MNNDKEYSIIASNTHSAEIIKFIANTGGLINSFKGISKDTIIIAQLSDETRMLISLKFGHEIRHIGLYELKSSRS